VVEYSRLPRSSSFGKLNNPDLERDCVLSGGDDYELVFTAAQGRRADLEALSRELALPLTRIGAIRSGDARLTVLDAEGKPMQVPSSFDHFR
jgi:thiamine-monophosphate kinase